MRLQHWLLSAAVLSVLGCTQTTPPVPKYKLVTADTSTIILKGKYLATIGVCNACHTPPTRGKIGQSDSAWTDMNSRTIQDWYSRLDHSMEMAGGVPFLLRFSSTSHGVVYSKNITTDVETGIGSWTDHEIFDALKKGVRKDGSSLFLFPPHSFFKHLADDDVNAIIAYLRTLLPIKNKILTRNLPFPTSPDTASLLTRASWAPGLERGKYLTSALVGCAECHSHTAANGTLQRFAGGNPSDPFLGVFRLGPDLPLRQHEKGLSAFPYPGYAILYSGNLTRFGNGGDKASLTDSAIVSAMRGGVKIETDSYGRPVPMGHVMMWQFYQFMSDDDAYSIAAYIKSLSYIPNTVDTTLYMYGTDWEWAFKRAFGQVPSQEDKALFGK